MLKTFGKTLLVLIATMMVADPLMACCFPSSLEPAIDVPVSDTQKANEPPCHGSKKTAPSTEKAIGSSDCPGCGDCTSMVSAAEHTETWAPVSATSDFEIDAASVATTHYVANRFSAALIVPDRPLPRIASTPVTLKLKLHI